MKTLIRFILIFAIFETYLACSQVNFAVDPAACGDSANCITSKGLLKFDEPSFISGSKIDILIINDNSASMSPEQRKLAEKFNLFIEKLEERFVDYRIAITTTDISNQVEFGSKNNAPREINKNGALQDGNLIPFSNGQNYLEHVPWKLKGDARTAEIQKQVASFKSTLVSPQTQQCEQFIANWISTKKLPSTATTEYGNEYYKNCPSGDERGIYAANLVLDKNPNGFIRPDAHLIMIFLSDENIRSNGISKDGGDAIDAVDLSDGLLDKFNIKFANSGKNLKVHSIVVKDDNCLAQQNDQILGTPPVTETRGFVRASIGSEYLRLSQATAGVSGDICAADYTSQLSEIEGQTHNLPIILKCAQAKDVSVHLLDAGGNVTRDIDFEVQGTEVKLKETLAPGSEISIIQFCDPSLVQK